MATIAFRMCIDCVDITKIIHFRLPNDNCNYIQETRRGGRDGQASLVNLVQSRTYQDLCG